MAQSQHTPRDASDGINAAYKLPSTGKTTRFGIVFGTQIICRSDG